MSSPSRPVGEILNRVRPLIEAGVVYTAMMLAFRPLALALGKGQASSAITQLLLFTLAPILWILLRRQDPGDFGLRCETPGFSMGLAFQAYAIVGPACLIFPLIAWLGSRPDEWLGGMLASAVFLATLPRIALTMQFFPNRVDAEDDGLSLSVLVSIVAAAAAVSALSANAVPIVSRLFYYGLVAGISEEIAFRGLLQTLLNRAFGRRWQWRGVRFGPGLLIAALLFGFAHAIVGSGFHLPLALFTAVFGLILGFLREKDGSVLAPALLHGLAGLPRAFFV